MKNTTDARSFSRHVISKSNKSREVKFIVSVSKNPLKTLLQKLTTSFSYNSSQKKSSNSSSFCKIVEIPLPTPSNERGGGRGRNYATYLTLPPQEG